MPKKMSAEYYRAYRERRKLAGNPVPRGSKTTTVFNDSRFIAWDGEGFTSNERIDEETFKHYFVLFANSEGDIIHREPGANRLTTKQCFDLLLATKQRFPKAVNVVYGGSYDMNHLLQDLPKDRVLELAKYGEAFYDGYFIRFFPRRSLSIKRGNVTVTLWDVIGFFQMSFVRAVEQWLGKDYPDLELIKEGKLNRADFTDEQLPFIVDYNNAELRALVALMERFRDAVGSLNLSLKRWDGAGAVAAAIFEKQGFKRHAKSYLPKPVELAGRHAYFGGRFELGQYGIHEGTVYGYDINSAYPTVFRDMPSLLYGRWDHVKNPSFYDADYLRNNPSNSISLHRVKWKFPGMRFCPFAYRDVLGLVSYPQEGENWVYGSELAAFLSVVPERPDWEIEVSESWVFVPLDSEAKPFAWVDDYYRLRQDIVDGRSDIPYGAQMVIKLGLNSLYGKTAQNLGYKPDSRKTPPFHNLIYAGHITATTRAKLWRAAFQNPEAIIMLATDGILSTEPLELDVSTEKILGKWESKTYDFICSIQSGVYVTRAGDNWSFRRRGIESPGEIAYFVQKVRKHWGNRANIYQKLPIPQSRLIGIKSAAISPEFYNRWGCWYNTTHDLMMEPGPQTKRQKDPDSLNKKPGKGLVHTIPTWNLDYSFRESISVPYERPWDREAWAWLDPEYEDEIDDGF